MGDFLQILRESRIQNLPLKEQLQFLASAFPVSLPANVTPADLWIAISYLNIPDGDVALAYYVAGKYPERRAMLDWLRKNLQTFRYDEPKWYELVKWLRPNPRVWKNQEYSLFGNC